MNILVFSWRDPKHPTAGGAEQVMHEHMKGWIKAGHKVTLFSSRIKGLPGKEILDEIKIIRKGDQYLGVKIAAFFFWLRNKESYGFVVDQFHSIPFFTPLYIKKPKLAVLQETTRRVWFLNEFPVPLSWIVGLIGYLVEPLVFLFYKTTPFMVGSDSAKDDLSRMGIPRNKITIVPHGVIAKIPNPFPKKEKIKTIVFLGALAKDKGIEDALKAFSILNNKGNFQFWVIGRGSSEYQAYLLSLCERLRIINKVKFWGFTTQNKKFELLARSHVLINPSVREGWGLVNIEANVLGVPVVSYKSPGLIDSVRERKSGIFCDHNDSDNIAKKVLELVNNPQEYKKLVVGAVRWSNKFKWGPSKQKSLDLINKIRSLRF